MKKEIEPYIGYDINELTNSEVKEVRAYYYKLIATINEANTKYYRGEDSGLTDIEFDTTIATLTKFEEVFPSLMSELSPTQRVGDTTAIAKRVTHTTPMLSLDNVFSIPELKAWLDNLKDTTTSFAAEYKYDGIALSLHYVDGELVEALTRGDGIEGESVLNMAKYITNIPNVLPEKITIEVRGEVVMTNHSFSVINTDNELAPGERRYSNPRNAAAGLMRSKKQQRARGELLTFLAYNVISTAHTTRVSVHDAISAYCFEMADAYVSAGSPDDIIDFVKGTAEERGDLRYAIDGIVITCADMTIGKELGFTTKFPLGSIAFKFPSAATTTTLEAVMFQVGRTGVITPVALLTPVQCGGVTISRATLHNEDEIERLGEIRIGDTVTLERRGDVIPKITNSNLDGLGERVVYPKKCPACKGPLAKKEDGVLIRCMAGFTCKPQRVNSISRFASRRVVDIDGLAESSVEALYAAYLVSTPSDLYVLKDKEKKVYHYIQDDVPKKVDLKSKTYRKILASIEASRDITLAKFIYALAIPGVGSTTSKNLAEIYKTITSFRITTVEALSDIKDVGPETANAVVDFFNDETTSFEVDRLIKQFKIRPVSDNGDKLYGKKFVITGSFDDISRDEIKSIIEGEGGKVSGSVSKSTTCLIEGRAAGSKLSKAISLGVTHMSWLMFKDAQSL